MALEPEQVTEPEQATEPALAQAEALERELALARAEAREREPALARAEVREPVPALGWMSAAAPPAEIPSPAWIAQARIAAGEPVRATVTLRDLTRLAAASA